MKYFKNIFKFYINYLQKNGIYVIIALKRKKEDKSNKFIDHYFTVFITNLFFFISFYILLTEFIINFDIYEKKSFFDIFMVIFLSFLCIFLNLIFFIKYFNKRIIKKLYKEYYFVKKPLIKSAILATIPFYFLLIYTLIKNY